MSNDSKERSKFSGMATKFESPVFLQNLGLMFDALEELSDFPVSTGILPHSLPEWAFRARPGLWRNCLFPKVARIAEQKFGSR